jgi:hypothetical protein
MLKVIKINKQDLVTQYEAYNDRQFHTHLDLEWCQAQGCWPGNSPDPYVLSLNV